MNILMFSQKGSSLALATRLQTEGHNVHIHIESKDHKEIGKGLVETYKGGIKWDIVVADDMGFGGICDKFKRAGIAVLNSSKSTDTLGLDTKVNRQSLSACGLQVPLTSILDRGVDLKLTAFFNGSNFLRPFVLSFIDYRLIEGSRGPLTDGMITTSIFKSKSRIFSNTMLKLRPLLDAMKYTGWVGLPCRVTSKHIIAFNLEFGFDRNVMNTIMPMMPQVGETIKKVASGADTLTTDDAKTECWSVGVTAIELSWPKIYSKFGSPIEVPKGDFIYVGDLFKDHETYKQAIDNAYLYTSTGISGSISLAASKAYKPLEELGATEVYWRKDAGHTAYERLAMLRRWNWTR